MPEQPTQQMLPFGEVTVESASPALPAAGRYEPSDEALAAYERLEGWLSGPRGPQTELTERTLRAVDRALIDGHKSFHADAESGLEMLKINNSTAEGPDIVPGVVPEGWDFHADVEAVLDELSEVMLREGSGPASRTMRRGSDGCSRS